MTNDVPGATLRKARGPLTQKAVAEALGVTRATVIAWEARAWVKADRAERYLRVVRDLASRADGEK